MKYLALALIIGVIGAFSMESAYAQLPPRDGTIQTPGGVVDIPDNAAVHAPDIVPIPRPDL